MNPFYKMQDISQAIILFLVWILGGGKSDAGDYRKETAQEYTQKF